VPDGHAVQTDQVLYNLARRGIEWDLLPACQRSGLTVMAYSPFDHGRTVLRHPAVIAVAERHSVTPRQVALAWVIRQDGITTIPKAAHREHIAENRAALDVQLTVEDFADLNRVPAARRPHSAGGALTLITPPRFSCRTPGRSPDRNDEGRAGRACRPSQRFRTTSCAV
jgi:diketogulonate reductase-like aldo/keto reductase